jgi:lipopolysaccharide/colanic/teichoic acid biosynthesis glycosyltransferase
MKRMPGAARQVAHLPLVHLAIDRLDTLYVENWSPLRDLGILLKTLPAVALHRGAY